MNKNINVADLVLYLKNKIKLVNSRVTLGSMLHIHRQKSPDKQSLLLIIYIFVIVQTSETSQNHRILFSILMNKFGNGRDQHLILFRDEVFVD